jgi:preprotein translocase subunit SecE
LFVRQVVAELRKVIWPTRHELVTYTTVALVFIAVMVGLVTGLDALLGKIVLEVFG